MWVHSTERIVQQVDISIEVHSTSQAYTLFLSTTKINTLKGGEKKWLKQNEIFEYIGKHQESWTIELTSTGIKGKYLIENVEVSSFF